MACKHCGKKHTYRIDQLRRSPPGKRTAIIRDAVADRLRCLGQRAGITPWELSAALEAARCELDPSEKP